jgi:hypothetical protein
MNEFFESVELIQTERIVRFPVVLMGRDYWGGLIHWMDERLRATQLIGPGDLELFQVVDEPEEAVEFIVGRDQARRGALIKN